VESVQLLEALKKLDYTPPRHFGVGFSYDFWKGSFYPDDLESEAMLAYYKRFTTPSQAGTRL
jgi:hypothetical protein